MAKDYGEYFNVAHIEPESHIYGPGKRFVIWLQGCSLACDGCWNQQMWSFKVRQLIHREELLQLILNADSVKGVTFLGGEPLQQSENLNWLLSRIRERSGLTIFIYSGFELAELSASGKLSWLSELSDILVLGRYVQSLRTTTSQWRGSTNQQVVYPIGSREHEKPSEVNQTEIHIALDGSLTILGYPDEALVSGLSSIE